MCYDMMGFLFPDTSDMIDIDLCLDDNYELESATVLPDRAMEVSLTEPLCVRTDVLREAQHGNGMPEVFKQIKKLGTFYLETAFHYNIYR